MVEQWRRPDFPHYGKGSWFPFNGYKNGGQNSNRSKNSVEPSNGITIPSILSFTFSPRKNFNKINGNAHHLPPPNLPFPPRIHSSQGKIISTTILSSLNSLFFFPPPSLSLSSPSAKTKQRKRNFSLSHHNPGFAPTTQECSLPDLNEFVGTEAKSTRSAR